MGQHFLADTNLLEAIVRDAALDPADVALEIGGGEGALTGRLASEVAHLHVVELDAGLAEGLRARTASLPNVSVVGGDAMRVDLAALAPEPTAVVSNLPYSIATPVLLRTIAELPEVRSWTVMVQREIADRLRAGPGSRTYGGPSVLVQLACEVELLRTVDRAVFTPRPRVDSALLRLVRRRPAASPELAGLVRAAFAHRRKPACGVAGALGRALARLDPRGAARARASTRTPEPRRSRRRTSTGCSRAWRSNDPAGAGEAEPLPVPGPAPRRRAARDPLAVLPADARRPDRGRRRRARRGGLPRGRRPEPGGRRRWPRCGPAVGGAPAFGSRSRSGSRSPPASAGEARTRPRSCAWRAARSRGSPSSRPASAPTSPPSSTRPSRWSGEPGRRSSRCRRRPTSAVVLVPAGEGLSTADVYAESDRLGSRAQRRGARPARGRASRRSRGRRFAARLPRAAGQRPGAGGALAATGDRRGARGARRGRSRRRRLVAGSGPTACRAVRGHRRGRPGGRRAAASVRERDRRRP